jgi:LPXTG-motif cell wall-anchored protein
MHPSRSDLPNDLIDTARRLEALRCEATPAELDRAYDRARRGSRRAGRTSSGVIAACLALGFASSGAGTTLAVSGLSSDGAAVVRAYPDMPSPTTPTGAPDDQSNTLGGGGQGGSPGGDAPDRSGVKGDRVDSAPDRSGVKGDRVNSAPGSDDFGARVSPGVQASRQTTATSRNDRLPMTGFAALPLLLGGFALVATGLVLRRRSSHLTD